MYPVCGGWAVFNGSAKGILMVEALPALKARVTVKLKWYYDFAYRVIGSTKGCATAHTSANKVFAAAWDLDNDGQYAVKTVEAVKDLAKLRSVRLFPANGGPETACGISFNFAKMEFASAGSVEPVAAPMAEGAFARFTKPVAKGLAVLRLTKSTGKAKLSLAVGGLDPSTQHTVFGSEAACGTPHGQTDLEFLHSGVSDPEGDLIDTALINTEDPYGLRSVRIVEGTGTGGPRVTCVEGYFVEIGGREVWIE